MGLGLEIGNFLNNITGVSSSSKSQYKYQKALQQNAEDFNATEAQKERDWQTAMSNTEHQRAVADMQKAGINPILAAGAGADVSGGASGNVATGSADAGTSGGNPLSMFLNAIATAKNIDKINTDIKNQTNKTTAEIKKLNAETKNINQNTNNGGTGGTSFTRTVDWSAKKIKKAKEQIDNKLNDTQKKTKSISWKQFKEDWKNGKWY